MNKIYIALFLSALIQVTQADDLASTQELQERYGKNATCADILYVFDNSKELAASNASQDKIRFKMIKTTMQTYSFVRGGDANDDFRFRADESTVDKNLNELNSLCRQNPDLKIGQILWGVNNTSTMLSLKNFEIKPLLSNVKIQKSAKVTAFAKHMAKAESVEFNRIKSGKLKNN